MHGGQLFVYPYKITLDSDKNKIGYTQALEYAGVHPRYTNGSCEDEITIFIDFRKAPFFMNIEGNIQAKTSDTREKIGTALRMGPN